jgi:hypothetical protein
MTVVSSSNSAKSGAFAKAKLQAEQDKNRSLKGG